MKESMFLILMRLACFIKMLASEVMDANGSLDDKSMTRGSQEPNLVFPLRAICQYSLILRLR